MLIVFVVAGIFFEPMDANCPNRFDLYIIQMKAEVEQKIMTSYSPFGLHCPGRKPSYNELI
jgi:hypothetical protein